MHVQNKLPVPNLFEDGDQNVTVTYFAKDPTDYFPQEYTQEWIASLQTCLGKDITNSPIVYSVVITTAKDIVSCCLAGNEIVNYISKYFTPNSIRVDIYIKGKQKTWIILSPYG